MRQANTRRTDSLMRGVERDAEDLRALPLRMLAGFAQAGSLAARLALTQIRDLDVSADRRVEAIRWLTVLNKGQ